MQFYFIFGKMLNPLRKFLNALGYIAIATNGQKWNYHLVTLSDSLSAIHLKVIRSSLELEQWTKIAWKKKRKVETIPD